MKKKCGKSKKKEKKTRNYIILMKKYLDFCIYSKDIYICVTVNFIVSRCVYVCVLINNKSKCF